MTLTRNKDEIYHGVHEVEPGVNATNPTGQSVQELKPEPENLPEAQEVQESLPMLVVPGGQYRQ